MLATAGLHIDQAPPLHLPLRFFATSTLFAILTGAALLFFGEELLIAPLLPVSVATLHLLLLGWLLMSVMGAMIQMIPVLAGIPVPWSASVPWVHGLLTIGVVAFFLGIATDWLSPWMLSLAAVGLGVAVVGFLLPIAMALIQAPAKHPTVNAMRIAMVSLTGTLLLGLLFLGEYAHGFVDLDRYALVGIHLTWGLLGTMGSLIIGVSFQVLPMFYMTPTFASRSANWILLGLGLFLLLMPVALLWSVADYPWSLYLAALPGLGALFVYAVEIVRLLKQRKRKFVDATLNFWRFGYFCGAISLLVLLCWPFFETERLRYLFGVLYVLGWVVSVITGMLHKIIPFLVWFHRFSPMAGLQEIPMMDDLSPLRAVNIQVGVQVATVVVLSLAIITDWDWAVRLGGGGLIAMGGLMAYALWFALRIKPPEIPETPDFASFFKDMPLPPK